MIKPFTFGAWVALAFCSVPIWIAVALTENYWFVWKVAGTVLGAFVSAKAISFVPFEGCKNQRLILFFLVSTIASTIFLPPVLHALLPYMSASKVFGFACLAGAAATQILIVFFGGGVGRVAK